jgi:hypothetical protein
VATILSPTNNASIEGKIIIVGTATDTNLDYYSLTYGEGSAPSRFENIGTYHVAVDGGMLGSWETTGLSGTYTLKLTALDKAGNSSAESIAVNISGGAQPVEESAAAVTCGPNPFNASSDSFHFSYNLSSNFATTIYVFDLTGNLLWKNSYFPGENGGKSGANTPGWNGRDSSDSALPNGIYIYQVISNQKIIGRGKIIFLR